MRHRRSESAQHDRLLGERLLTVEWQRRELPDFHHTEAGGWLLISTTPGADALATALSEALARHGARCETMGWPPRVDEVSSTAQLDEQLRAGAFVGVAIVTGPTTRDADERGPQTGREYVQHLVHVTRELAQMSGQLPHVFVVTRAAQAVLADDIPNLEQGGLRGLLRVIGAEHPHLHPVHIDIDEDTGADQLARQLLSGSEEDETAWRNGDWYTARLIQPAVPEDRRTTLADYDHDGIGCRSAHPGIWRRWNWLPANVFHQARADRGRRQRLQHQLRRRAGGDGPLPGHRRRPARVGDGFRRRGERGRPRGHRPPRGRPRRRVLGHGCWGTFVTCDARLAATLPPELTEHQAVAVATARHRLVRPARSGQNLGRRPGADPLGDRRRRPAAIGVARAAGAEIFATAGSEYRRQMLRDMGIKHVYDSRSIDFADQIRRDTDGYGVDIVLNSLTGAAQRAGLELLAIGGRFVEIGKRDVYGNTRLELFPFRRNLTFYYVDLALMSLSHPERVSDCCTPCTGSWPTVSCRRQAHHYPLAEAATAIRIMSAAEHTGKLLLEVPARGAPASWSRPSMPRYSDPTAHTSSPAAWAASGCSSPRRWRPPAADASCSPPVRSRHSRRWRLSS